MDIITHISTSHQPQQTTYIIRQPCKQFSFGSYKLEN